MDLGLTGKRAIVCASSRGLGRGCAEALAAEGCEVIINGRDAARLNDTADAIRTATGATVTAIVADVGTDAGRAAILEACPEPDILVNNNSGPPFADFRTLDEGDIVDGVRQNMVTPIMMIKAVVDGMAERGFGRIVNITSSSVFQPIPGLDLSSGARAGLTAFVAGVSRTIAHHNVTVNNLLPGKFATDRLQSNLQNAAKRMGKTVEEATAIQKAQVPAKRFGTPEEFGMTCAFLCSAQAGYITGQNVLIDGGFLPRAF